MHRASKNVATSQRRDVPTSRRPNVATSQRWVYKNKSQQAATSQRQRDFCLSIIKSKRGPEFEGVSRDVRTRARKAKQQRRKSVKKTVNFVFFFFLEILMMFYRLNTCVLTPSMF